MGEIAAFGGRRPLKAWVYRGVECCIYASYSGSRNGYVRLPSDHPDMLAVRQLQSQPSGRIIFGGCVIEGVPESGLRLLTFSAPSEWSYGVDPQGWVGWITSLGDDGWSMADRLAAFPDSPEDRERILACAEPEPTVGRRWTMPDLVAEVEATVDRLKERQ